MADILFLVEELEQVLARGWRIPFTTNAVIDEDAFIDIVEQLHIALPTEIREAQQLMAQREEILAEAHVEAEAITQQAHEKAADLVAESPIVVRAEEERGRILADARERAEVIQNEARKKADEVIAQAAREARGLQTGADEYAVEVLQRIRDELDAYLRQVDNGLERLERDLPLHREAAQADATAAGDDAPEKVPAPVEATTSDA